MKTEQEQICEIMKIIANADLPLQMPNRDECFYRYIHSATDLYKVGYRKATNTIDEFVERLEKRFEQTETIANCLHGRTNTEIDRIINIVAAEMRQEVEK